MSERVKPQTFNRRVFLTRTAEAATGTVALLTVGCGSDETKKTPTVTQNLVKDTPSILTESSYRALSPKEKLKAIESRGLEQGAYSEIPNFNPERELVLAIVDAYSQVAPLTKSAKTLSDNVLFQDKNSYLDALGSELNKTLSTQERELEASTRPEFTTSNGVVHLNRAKINEIVSSTSTQDVAKKFTKNELTVKIFESIIFHALTHANNNAGSVQIDGFSLSLPGSNGPVNFQELQKFDFIGTDTTGNKLFIHGSNEAITEFVGRAVTIKATGQYLSLSDMYIFGANMIAELNQRAGISVDEFLSYNSSEQTAKLFQKWGSIKNPNIPDAKQAELALAVIGLAVQGTIKQKDAISYINQNLTPAKPIPVN